MIKIIKVLFLFLLTITTFGKERYNLLKKNDWFYPLPKAFGIPKKSDYPIYSAVIILNETVHMENMIVRNFQAVLFEKSAFDLGDVNISDVYLEGNTLQCEVKGRTILPSGKVIELKDEDIYRDAEIDKYTIRGGKKYLLGSVKFRLPAIEEGCVIQYQIMCEYNEWIQPIYEFGGRYPYIVDRVVYNIPEPYDAYFELAPENLYHNAAEYSYKGNKYIKFTFGAKTSGFPDEPYTPTIIKTKPHLLFVPKLKNPLKINHVFSSWESLTNSTRNICENSAIRPKNVNESDLVKSGGDKKNAIITAIRNLEKLDMPEDSYLFLLTGDKEDVAYVYLSYLFDISTKTFEAVKLLRKAGYEAYPALIVDADIKHINKDIVSFGWFDRFIVAIKEGNGWVFNDPSSMFTPFGNLPNYEYNCDVLIYGKANHWLFTTTPSSGDQKNELEIKYNIRFDGTGKYLADAYAKLTGGNSSLLIKEYHDEVDSLEKDKILKRYLAGNDKDVLAVIKERTNLSNPDIPVEFSATLSRDTMIIGDSPLVNALPFYDSKFSSSFTSPKRFYDIEFTNPIATKIICDIQPPEGYAFKKLPQDISIKSEFGEYLLRFENIQSGIRVERIFKISLKYIDKSKYQEFRNFLKEVSAGDSTILVLEKKP